MINLPGIKNLLKWLYKRYSNKILPRYYVFAFDVIVVFVSYYVAYAVRLNLDLSAMEMDFISSQAIFVSFVYTLHFWSFRSFTGIVRYTGLNEIYRLFKAMAWAFFMVICAVLFNRALGLSLPFVGGSSVPLIHFLISFFVLMAARLVIKSVFQSIVKSSNAVSRNVIIFGAGSAGIITREALLQDYTTNYNVVAFIDDNKSKIGKHIEGAPIMLPADALSHNFAAKANPDLLIIAAQQVPQERKRVLIEQALELQLEVKTVPPVQNWINGTLSTEQLKRVHLEELMGRRPIVLGIEHVAREIHGKVVLITGAAGSIGSELSRQVLSYNPKQLILLDQAESEIFNLQFEINSSPELKEYAHLVEYVIASIKDANRIESVFKQYNPELIYHAAAYKHVPLMEDNPYEALAVNVFGTRTLADLAVKYNARKFVMVSTDKAVNPTNVMGTSKRIAEIYTQSIDAPSTKFVTTRFGNVLDSSGSVIPIFRKQIERGGPLTVTHRDVTRYFMLIPEACILILEAGTMGQGADIFVFDMGKPVKIYDVARRMIQLSGKVPNQDIMIQEVGLRPGEKLYEELLANNENTLPTNHEKIMRAKVSPYSRKKVLQHLKELEAVIQQGNKTQMVEKMKEIVPEFASTNPSYHKSE
jgi:FlaA1/EpsC-like NDP-sugar epimerase